MELSRVKQFGTSFTKMLIEYAQKNNTDGTPVSGGRRGVQIGSLQILHWTKIKRLKVIKFENVR